MKDALVQSIRAAAIRPVRSQSEGVVMLNLSTEQGGSREFNGVQIRYIADAISTRYTRLSQSDIEKCQRLYPQLSKSYAEYGKIINDIDNDIAALRQFATKLEGAVAQ
jgi:hypothetical protein